MKRLGAYLLVAVAVLFVAAAFALGSINPIEGGEQDVDLTRDSPEASQSQPTRAAATELLKAGGEPEEDDAGDENAVRKPFIGIEIHTLSSAEAEELGIEGGAVVRRVLDGGTAEGILEPGDIIIATDAGGVTTAGDMVMRVRQASPGDLLSLVVRRGDTVLNVSVPVGEREVRSRGFHLLASPIHQRPFSHLGRLPEAFVRSETVFKTDDGFKTYTAVTGNISNLDVGGGTFTLTPLDGTDDIDYAISDDTRVINRQTGDLGGLSTDDKTLVVDVDGEVKLVAQGNFAPGGHISGLRSMGRRSGIRGVHGHKQRGFRSFRAVPTLRQRFHEGFPAVPPEVLRGADSV